MQKTLLACALAAAAPAAFADTFAPGLIDEPVAFAPGTLVATLSDRTFVAFDGTDVTYHSEGGGRIATLASLSGTDYASFVRVDPSETFVVVGESLNGGIYRVPLTGGGATLVCDLDFNYDAAFGDADTLWVSADADMAPGNELYRVTLSSGAFAPAAVLDGFSGPLALAPDGSLFYGTAQFPVPPTGAEVLRFSAAQLALGGLTNADAELVGDGFPGAASLACDPATGELYLAASDFGSGTNEVVRVEGDYSASWVAVAGAAGDFINNLEFLPELGAPYALRPFQPEGGGRLRYSSLGGRTELAALRPQAFLSGPGLAGPGVFDVSLADGPPLGTAYTLYGPAGLVPPAELAVFLPGQGLSVFLGLDLFTMLYDAAAFALDGSGSGAKSYTNPGGLAGTLAIQVLALDPVGRIAGTSDVLFN